MMSNLTAKSFIDELQLHQNEADKEKMKNSLKGQTKTRRA